MSRRLFCSFSPFTYWLSVQKGILLRRLHWLFNHRHLARTHSDIPLPVLVSSTKSLIRRRLGNVDMHLQENKAVNLSLTAPKLTGILIRPGETFSFWRTVGRCRRRQGYREGLIIRSGKTDSGTAGGMCQMTNLLHWMALHSPLEVTEHHHHNNLDLFPDYNRQIPFGTGTSIMYNYLDYQLTNHTENTFQMIVYTDGTYLCGELRAADQIPTSYHISEEDRYFYAQDGQYYRHNRIFRETIDKRSGNIVDRRQLIENRAKVMYDKSFIDPVLIREPGKVSV